jgi:hypothetical protein
MGQVVSLSMSQLPSWIRGMGQRIAHVDLRPAYRIGRQLCVNNARQSIIQGKSPDGTPYKGLVMPRARTKGKDIPLRDTGALLASLGAGSPYVIDTVTTNFFEYGSRLIYARLMNEGGTIRPTKAKALAIPRTPEAVRAGSPRRFPRPLQLIWPKGKKSGRLVERTSKGKGKNQTIVTITHFLLLLLAEVPARPFLQVTSNLIEQVYSVVTDYLIEKAL